jgi:hypothetical protein
MAQPAARVAVFDTSVISPGAGVAARAPRAASGARRAVDKARAAPSKDEARHVRGRVREGVVRGAR